MKIYADHCNSDQATGQILIDKSEWGKVYPWLVYKQSAELLVLAMLNRKDYFSDSSIERVEKCSSYLSFLQCIKNPRHPKTLTNANFCKNRLCVGCQMRRSLKTYATTIQIMHWLLNKHPSMNFIFLTLTVPNVQIDELRTTIDHLFHSWKKLYERKQVKKVMEGYLRVMEITYNHKEDTYHPHFHVLIPVKKSYFTGRDYLSRDKWLELWRQSTKQPEITQVDVRKVKVNDEDDLASVCGEIAKYATKTWSTSSKQSNRQFLSNDKNLDFGVQGHLWLREDAQKTGDVIVELGAALKGRRLLQYGGIMRDAKKQLGIQDGEDEGADLIKTSDEDTGCKCPVCSGDREETVYLWNKAVGNYVSDYSRPYDASDKPKFVKAKTSEGWESRIC